MNEILRLIKGEVCMGTYGLVELELRKLVDGNDSSHNSAMPKLCAYHKSGAQCIWGLRGCCKESLPCEVRADLRQ